MLKLGGKLTALAVKCAAQRGILSDGNGLCLQVARGGSRSWILRYHLGGKRRHLGLGGYPTVSLAEARERAMAARVMLQSGKDPIAARRGQRIAAVLSAAKAMSFSECATAFIDAHAAGWVAKNTAQWRSSLTRHAFPLLAPVPVQSVDTALVMKVLEPLWRTKTVTASRVRSRIEMVLDWAKTHGHRTGENPARWDGHLENLLPAPSKVAAVEHHPALAYAELPAFMADLHQQPGTAARAFEFLVLTAARAGEVRLADWAEIDLQTRVWTVPASKMKMGREHRVPLSSAAIGLLEALPKLRTSGLVFPGTKPGQPIGSTQLSRVLERMDCRDVTAHGMRATFSTWAAERTKYPSEVVEAALAHVTGKVVRAYRRTDHLEDRARLMEQWSRFCAGEVPVSADIIDLEQRRA